MAPTHRPLHPETWWVSVTLSSLPLSSLSLLPGTVELYQPYRYWNLPLKIAANSVSTMCSCLCCIQIYFLCVFTYISNTRASIHIYIYKLSFTEHPFSGRIYIFYFLEITANIVQEILSTNSHHAMASHHMYSCSNTSGFLISHCCSQSPIFWRLSSSHTSFFP